MFTDKELQVILDAVHELNNLDRYSILHFGSDHPYCVCCSGKCTTEEYHDK